MKKLLEVIKKIMARVGRFILNTDYVAPRNDESGVMKLTIPNYFTSPPGSPVVFSTSQKIGTSAGTAYRAYLTSTMFNYAGNLPFSISGNTPGGPQGLNGISINLRRSGNTFYLEVRSGTQGSTETYTGFGQTITVHIQTFADPFSKR